MFSAPSIDSSFMGKPKVKPDTVSHLPLFEWFAADKKNRAKLRAAGYTDGRITNWKRRKGIPRGEVSEVARIMGLNHEAYLAMAGEDGAPPIPATQDYGINLSILTYIISEVEAFYSERDEELSPESKGKLIALLYDIYADKGQVDRPAVEKYAKHLRLVR